MKTIYWVLVIAVFGILIYCNSLNLSFRWDDTNQIVNAPFIHEIKNVPLMFLTSIHHVDKESILFGYYYKPIMFSLYGILYALGDGQAQIFHLTQLALHISNSILIFLLFKKFFSEKLSFLLALLFLVHPINEETVVYIANLQDTLYFFFGTFAIFLILKWKQEKLYQIIIVGFFLLLSCLSKETGILYLLLAFASTMLFINKKNEIRSIGMLATVGATYLTLRILSSTHYFVQMTMISTPLLERLKTSPYVLGFYLREAIVPTDLITEPKHFAIPSITSQEYFISLIFIVIFFLFWICTGRLIWKRQKKNFKIFLFFSIWFFLGISLYLQIFHLDQFIAKRWFYFPLAGLLGIVGSAINLIPKLKNSQLLSITFIALIIIFAARTYTMNTYWKSDEVLKKHLLQK